MGSVVAGLEQVARLLVAERRRNLDNSSADELIAAQALAGAVRRHLDLLSAAILAATARAGAYGAEGDASPEAMVARTQGQTRQEAGRQVRVARFLEESPLLRERMVEPGMSTRKASIIAEAMDRLPRGLSAAEREVVEAELVRVAPTKSVEQLSRKAKRAVEAVDVEMADQIENHELTRAEAAQAQAATFWMTRPDEAGMVKGGFTIDAVTADMLRAVVEAQTSPRRRLDTGEADVEQDVDCGDLLDERPDWKHRAGAAFSEIIRYLPSGEFGNHGGVAATLMVTVTEDSLRERTDAAGVTEFGTRVSAGQLRQMACTAGIVSAVLGQGSQVLDLGREKRLYTNAQRLALAHRDGGCAFPGCDRPPGWCESHHIVPWARGGPTTIENGVLLCGTHHRLMHHSEWEVRLGTDRNPEFLPPARVDPTQEPRRNHYYRARAA